MSTREAAAPSREIASQADLTGWIAEGEKPRDRWRIGTEHEKFVFKTGSLEPVPYAGEAGIRALMEGMMARFGWEPIMEGDNLIALRRPKSEAVPGEIGGSISLEPGGQFELSGAPLANLHDTAKCWQWARRLESGSWAWVFRRSGRSPTCRRCPSSVMA